MTHGAADRRQAQDGEAPWLSTTLTWLWPEALVILIGVLDEHTAPQLTRRLDEAVAQRPSRVVLDLSGVSSVDWRGVLALRHASDTLAGEEGSLVLVDAPDALRSLVPLLGMDATVTTTSHR